MLKCLPRQTITWPAGPVLIITETHIFHASPKKIGWLVGNTITISLYHCVCQWFLLGVGGGGEWRGRGGRTEVEGGGGEGEIMNMNISSQNALLLLFVLVPAHNFVLYTHTHTYTENQHFTNIFALLLATNAFTLKSLFVRTEVISSWYNTTAEITPVSGTQHCFLLLSVFFPPPTPRLLPKIKKEHH